MSRLLKKCAENCLLCSDEKPQNSNSSDHQKPKLLFRPSMLNHNEENCVLCTNNSEPIQNSDLLTCKPNISSPLGDSFLDLHTETQFPLGNDSQGFKDFETGSLPDELTLPDTSIHCAKLMSDDQCESLSIFTGSFDNGLDNGTEDDPTSRGEIDTIPSIGGLTEQQDTISSLPEKESPVDPHSSDNANDNEGIIVLKVDENDQSTNLEFCPQLDLEQAGVGGSWPDDNEDEVPLARISFTNYTCEKCRTDFTSPLELDQHIHVCGVQYPTACFDCKKMVDSEAALRFHLDCHQREKAARSYTCGYCKDLFRSQSHLVAHIKINRTCRKVTTLCRYCGYYTQSQEEFADHIKTHREKTHQYMCDQCDELFQLKKSLMRHIQTAHNQEKYCCESCGKMFMTIDHLKRHMKGHNERQHVCLDCGQKFVLISHLRTHMKKHFKEVPADG